ncbi:hypothetical protein [Maribellus luteus]|nr:hypothetical protein [Maribellus luteus]
MLVSLLSSGITDHHGTTFFAGRDVDDYFTRRFPSKAGQAHRVINI